MAKFSAELPLELMKQFKALEKDTEKILGEMVDAGAEVAKADMQANMKKVFKSTKGLEDCLVVKDATEVTDGVGKLVGFDGYFVNEQGKTVPAGLVAYAREYGTSSGEQKKPFIRKSFKKAKITSAMLKVQEKYIHDE